VDRLDGVTAAATLVVGALILLAFLWVALVSVREDESRAARRAVPIGALLSLPYFLVGFLSFEGRAWAAATLLSLTAIAILVLVLPIGTSRPEQDEVPRGRIDERDIMFSRRLLQVGSPRFEEYYAANPEKRAPDDAFRKLPGLLEKGSAQYDPYSFAAADASFTTVEALRPVVEGAPASEVVPSDPARVTEFIKRWVRKMGAVSVGVTQLRDYHLYTVIGRGEQYGQPVALTHDYAVALTVEMDKEMVDRAPMGPIVMESARQYLDSGAMAVQVAEFIRNLGYEARAHIDGNYRVLCPLVARDAGLGEIGRMGLLMTPELGPRVRIAVVTTDLPLVTDERRCDPTMVDFCVRCSKCADACPSDAIPVHDRVEIDGVERWRIDSEACFTLWCKMGTDCGRCMSVCPYSHPNNLLHNLVRGGVRNSSLFRRLAIWMDDVFYGKPPPSPLPDWMRVG
jgi:reductive dehalogenase